MKIFITGANGYVGEALLKRLAKTKHTIFALSRQKVNSTNIRFIHGDLLNPNSFNKQLNSCDIFINLAAKKSNWGKQEDFDNINAYSLKKLVSKNTKIKHLIAISSVYVHGIQKKLPIKEDSPYGAKGAYGKSKILLEKIVKEIAEKYKIKYTILRPAIIYGGNDRDVGFMTKLIKLIREGKFVYIGNGKNHIHLIHIDNLVEALMAVIQKPAQNKTYILAGPDAPTLNQIVTHVTKKLHVQKKFTSFPKLPFYILAKILENTFHLLSFINYFAETEPPLNSQKLDIISGDYVYNIDKAKKELSFRPKVKTLDGIDRLL